MKISIALASFNGARYLGEQLESFLSQRRLPDELVVSDDGSTDGTLELLRDFASRAPFPVRIEANAGRRGVAGNFDHALGMASGDLVLPSDQDDVWFPEKLAVIEALAQATPGRACFINDAELTDGALLPTGLHKRAQIRAAGLPDEAMVMGCCCAFRRALLQALLPIPSHQAAHDNWLVQSADALGMVLRIDDTLQYYRRHGDNVSDFHVNRIRPATASERVHGVLRDSARRLVSGESLEREWRFHDALRQRLVERRGEFLGFMPEDALHDKERAIAARTEALAARRAIRALPAWRRPRAALMASRRGTYALSGGRSGMLKDVLLPRPRTRAP